MVCMRDRAAVYNLVTTVHAVKQRSETHDLAHAHSLAYHGQAIIHHVHYCKNKEGRLHKGTLLVQYHDMVLLSHICNPVSCGTCTCCSHL